MLSYSKTLSTLAIAAAVTVLAGPLAAGEAVAATSDNASECDPEPPFNFCLEVNLDEVVYWQDTLGDPQWRQITPVDDEPAVDYRIDIDVTALNGGVIPTKPGQGHYEDVDEYVDQKNALLGLDQVSGEHLVETTTSGRTIKVDTAGDPVPESTSILVHDAMSNEDGRIFIDGEDVTERIIDFDRASWWEIEQSDGTTVSGGMNTLSGSSVSMTSLGFAWLPLFFAIDDDYIDAGDYNATQWLTEGFLGEDTTISYTTELGNTRRNTVMCQVGRQGSSIVGIDCFAAHMFLDTWLAHTFGYPHETVRSRDDYTTRLEYKVHGAHFGPADELPVESLCSTGLTHFGGSNHGDGFVKLPETTVEECELYTE